MAYKVMGITAGRKNGNSEILLKEALTVCEEQGAEVTMINLRDFNILDCTGCTACTKAMSQGKHIGCTLDSKDDKKKIMDVMLNQDAVIFSVPTYDLMPASAYLTFAHRSLSYGSELLLALLGLALGSMLAPMLAHSPAYVRRVFRQKVSWQR